MLVHWHGPGVGDRRTLRVLGYDVLLLGIRLLEPARDYAQTMANFV